MATTRGSAVRRFGILIGLLALLIGPLPAQPVAAAGKPGIICLTPPGVTLPANVAAGCNEIVNDFNSAMTGATLAFESPNGDYVEVFADPSATVQNPTVFTGNFDISPFSFVPPFVYVSAIGPVTLAGNSSDQSVITVHTGLTITFDHFTISGGMGPGYGGGIVDLASNVTISNSTIINNSDIYTTGGGGIDNEGGTLTLINDTITQNSSGPGTASGVYSHNGTTNIWFTDIINNTSSTAGGGGLYVNGGTVTVHSSVISGNTPINLAGSPAPSVTASTVGALPGLGLLANNGGTVKTILPPPSVCISGEALINGLLTDARGALRPQPQANNWCQGPVQLGVTPPNTGIRDEAPSQITAHVGTPYTTQIVSGGSGVYRVNDFSLPPGLTAYGTGYIQGAPTQAGNFQGWVEIEDVAGQTLFINITFIVDSGPNPPPAPTYLHPTGATYNSLTFSFSEGDPLAQVGVNNGNGLIVLGPTRKAPTDPRDPVTLTYTVYGVPYGGYTCLTAVAWNAYGASAYTPWVCGQVVPLTPYGPHVTGATTSAVSFGWTNYDSLSYIAAYDGTTNHALGQNATSYTAPTAAGYFSCITVAAYNATYTSPYSAWVCGLAKPAMPSNVHVTGNGQGSVSFAWTNHDPYSGIALTNDGVHLLNEGTNATSYTQNGLASGQYACIEIAAYNSSGASPYTSWVCGQAN